MTEQEKKKKEKKEKEGKTAILGWISAKALKVLFLLDELV